MGMRVKEVGEGNSKSKGWSGGTGRGVCVKSDKVGERKATKELPRAADSNTAHAGLNQGRMQAAPVVTQRAEGVSEQT